MKKNNIILTAFLLFAFGASGAPKLKSTTKATKRVPKKGSSLMEFKFSSKVQTNIDSLSERPSENTFTQVLGLKSKFKFRPFKRVVLISLPSANLELAPNQKKELRQYGFSHSFLGLYFPNRTLNFNGSLATSYQKGFSFDELGEKEDKEYLAGSSQVGMNLKLTKSYHMGFALQGQLREHFRPSKKGYFHEDDFLQGKVKCYHRLLFSKSFSAQFHLDYSRKWFREKRSLTDTGAEWAETPETLDRYSAGLTPRLKLGGLSFIPQVGYVFQEDIKTNGNTYKGPEGSLKISWSLGKFEYVSKASYKMRKFDSQQINPSEKIGSSPRLELDIINLNNDILYYWKNHISFSIGHGYFQIKSNRNSEESINNIFQVGLNLKI